MVRLTGRLQTRQTQKLTWRIELSNLIELPEDKFAEIVKNIEREPLFERLMYSERVISYARFPYTQLSGNFYELKEGITADSGSFNVESILEAKNAIIRLVKQLGLDKFEKYFLYNKNNLSPHEISLECKLIIEEVKRINDFIDEISIHNEFYNPSTIGFSPQIRYTRVASIERNNEDNMENEFMINMFSPHLARGKYVINYEKRDDMKKRNVFSKEEVRRINELIKKLELFNVRKSTIYRIIKNILDRQINYFKSNDLKDLVPFSQKELAQKIGIDESIRKEIRKNLIKEIIITESTERALLTDNDIKRKLNETSGISISRRSITACRKELKIPSVFKRKSN
jgi:hypothetical protein